MLRQTMPCPTIHCLLQKNLFKISFPSTTYLHCSPLLHYDPPHLSLRLRPLLSNTYYPSLHLPAHYFQPPAASSSHSHPPLNFTVNHVQFVRFQAPRAFMTCDLRRTLVSTKVHNLLLMMVCTLLSGNQIFCPNPVPPTTPKRKKNERKRKRKSRRKKLNMNSRKRRKE